MGFTENASRLGEVIREARKAKGLSQTELADALGVKQPSVSAWESGRVLPSVPTLSQIRTLLNIDPGDVLDAVADDAPAACG